MVHESERQHLQSLLKDTITLLCCNSLPQYAVRQINALIGVTLDTGEVVLITINDVSDTADQKFGKADDSDVDPIKRKSYTASSNMNVGKVEVDEQDILSGNGLRKPRKRNSGHSNEVGLSPNQEIEIGSETDDGRLTEDNGEASLHDYNTGSKLDSSYNEYNVGEILQWQMVKDRGESEFSKGSNQYRLPKRKFYGNSQSLEYSPFTGLKPFVGGLPRSKGPYARRGVPTQKRQMTSHVHKSGVSQPSGVSSSMMENHGEVCDDESLMSGRACYQCTACTAVFNSQLALRSHVNGVHLRVKASRCPECGESFTWRSGLSRHRRRGQCPVWPAFAEKFGNSDGIHESIVIDGSQRVSVVKSDV